MTADLGPDRFRRAILAQIAFGNLSQQSIDWYLTHYFAALDRTWVLEGCSRAVVYGPSIDAEQIFRKIITAQHEKAGQHP